MIYFNATLSARHINITRPFRFVSLNADTVERVLSASSATNIIDRDAVFLRSNTATTVSDYRMRALSLGGAGSYNLTWYSSNTAVSIVDQFGTATYVSDGTASITASASNQHITRTLVFSQTNSATTDSFVSYVSGSLSRHISDAVDSRISNKSASTALRIFNTQDHVNAIYVRNPQVWCADLNITCISPWNSTGGAGMAGTLISPRHIIFAWHYQLNNGSTIRFIKNDGTVVTRTMVNKTSLPNASLSKDITIGVLDSDVPADISFARVLPANFTNKIPALGYNRSLPALCLDQEEKALVSDWASETTSSSFITPKNTKRLEFYEEKIGGDSGNPAFVIINNQLVILTVWTFGGAGSGSSIMANTSAINLAMTSLGGGYQLTEVSLSGFPNY